MNIIVMILTYLVLIPIRTDRHLKRVPYITYLIIFLNILIYLSTLSLSNASSYTLSLKYGFVLADITWYSFITNAFLHADLMHLLGNMFILWIAGTVLESAIGRAQFVMIYFASAITGVILFALATYYMADPKMFSIPLIGASGAIAGVIGFAAFRYYYIKVQTIFGIIVPFPILYWMPFWGYALYFFIKELILGFSQQSSNVAHFAHLGGLFLGAVLAIIFRSYRDGLRDIIVEQAGKRVRIGKKDDISEAVSSLLEENPDDPELLVTEAGIKAVNKDILGATEIYVKALGIALRQGNYQTAMVSFENILDLNSDTILDPRTYLALFTLYEKDNNMTRMNQVFDIVLTRYTHSTEAESILIKMANYCAKTLNYKDRAITYYTYLIDHYPNSGYVNIARDELEKLL